MTLGQGLLTRERIAIATGLVIGYAFFLYNLHLPPLLRGEHCCDSGIYVGMASRIHSWRQFFGDYSSFTLPDVDDLNRTRGYPFYLFFHRWILSASALTASRSWLKASLFTCILLHFGSVIYLFRSVARAGIRLHPVALALALASPGLTSSAALTVTDTLTTSFVSLALGGILRGNPLLAGASLGFAVLCRPSLQVASVAVLAAWAALELLRRRDPSATSPPSWKRWTGFLALLAYAVLLSPQYVACTRAYGRVCYLKPGYTEKMIAQSILGARGFAMYYTSTGSPRNPPAVSISDPFLQELFADCRIREDHPLGDELRCLAHHWPQAPVFFGKRVIGLFDHFHLNTYATWVTSMPVRIWLRAFATLAFLGFGCVCGLFLWGLWRRKPDPWLLLAFFAVAYIGMSTLAHVEPRYAFPVLPVAVFALIFVIQEIVARRFGQRMWVLGLLLLAGIVFNVQAIAWDRADPAVYESIDSYLPHP